MHKTMTAESPKRKLIASSQPQSIRNSYTKIDLSKIKKLKKNDSKEDEEIFDRHMATAVMQTNTPSITADTNLNPLFMNTKRFNIKTSEYAAAKLQ